MQKALRSVKRAGQATHEAVVRRHRPDYQIVLYMGLLMLLGVIMMYAIGPQRANVLNFSYGTDFYTDTYFFTKQFISLLLSLAVFVAVSMTPLSWLQKHAKTLLSIGIGACIVLAIAGWTGLGIAQCSLGACRWFDLGPLGSVQPVEILKLGLLIFLASFLAVRIKQDLINDLYKTLIPLGALVLLAIILVIGIQKDMGSGVAMLAIVASMMMVGGTSKKVGGILIAAAILIGIFMILVAPHRIERVATFLSGDAGVNLSDPASYHISHAKIAIGTGGVFGVGIGNSVQATGYLPEAINDSVFAIMGEIFGFVGLTVVLLLFTALLMRLLKTADKLPSIWMKLVVAGVFGWLASHVILNVASMTGVFPLTGVTLPLLSFGGTSMVFMAAALGLAFQVSRYTTHGSNKETSYENLGSRRRIGRTRHTSRRSTSRT